MLFCILITQIGLYRPEFEDLTNDIVLKVTLNNLSLGQSKIHFTLKINIKNKK